MRYGGGDAPINEPVLVPEIFVTGIADYEELAGVARIALYAEKNLFTCGTEAPYSFPRERIIQARLVTPIECCRAMLREMIERTEPDPILRAAFQKAMAAAH